MYANRRNFRVAKEIVVEEHFRPEMEIRPFRAYAMKNMQYNSYLWPNCRHFRIIKEIGVLIRTVWLPKFKGVLLVQRCIRDKNFHEDLISVLEIW